MSALTDTEVLSAALLAGCTLLSVAVGFLAHSVSRAVNVTVTQPPITVNVQAPVSLLPPQVQATLDAIDAKLTPALQPATNEQLAGLVREGVAIAELSKLKGSDRFRIAKDYVSSRAAAQLIAVNERELGLAIEAEHALSTKK